MNFYSKNLSESIVLCKKYAEKFDKNANLTTLQPSPKYKNRTRARLPTARLPITLTPYVYVLPIHLPMGLRSWAKPSLSLSHLAPYVYVYLYAWRVGLGVSPLRPALGYVLCISLFIRITYTFMYMYYVYVYL